MANRATFFLGLFVLLIFCGPSSAGSGLPDLAHDTEVKLRSKTSAYSLHAPDFGHALILLAKDFKIPMGLEWTRSQQTLSRVNMTWHDATLRQMIEKVVSSQTGYKVEVNEGIVHIFPVAEQKKNQNFLNLRIESFRTRNKVVEVASHQLRDSVRSLVLPPDPQSRSGLAYSQGTNVGDPPFTVSMEKATVRQVLNQFIMLSDRKIWVATFVSDAPTRHGIWPTATLWTDVDVPDSEQPVWDLLRWTDSIP